MDMGMKQKSLSTKTTVRTTLPTDSQGLNSVHLAMSSQVIKQVMKEVTRRLFQSIVKTMQFVEEITIALKIYSQIHINMFIFTNVGMYKHTSNICLNRKEVKFFMKNLIGKYMIWFKGAHAS